MCGELVVVCRFTELSLCEVVEDNLVASTNETKNILQHLESDSSRLPTSSKIKTQTKPSQTMRCVHILQAQTSISFWYFSD